MEQCLIEWKVRCETDRFTSSETHSSAKARRYRKRERERGRDSELWLGLDPAACACNRARWDRGKIELFLAVGCW